MAGGRPPSPDGEAGKIGFPSPPRLGCPNRDVRFAAFGRYGLRLLPELYEHLNPMPFEAAAEMDNDLAEDLRRNGYTVTGGH